MITAPPRPPPCPALFSPNHAAPQQIRQTADVKWESNKENRGIICIPAIGPQSGDGSDVFHLLPSICGAFFFGTVIQFYSFQRSLQQVQAAS